jgi:hypothetical protein
MLIKPLQACFAALTAQAKTDRKEGMSGPASRMAGWP